MSRGLAKEAGGMAVSEMTRLEQVCWRRGHPEV